MKKMIIAALLISTLLVGCSTEPAVYGDDGVDYSKFDNEDYHVNYAIGKRGCYSDGSFSSNLYVKQYMKENWN